MSTKKRFILVFLFVLALVFAKTVDHYKQLISNAQDPTLVTALTPLKSIFVPILIYHYVEYVKDDKDTIRKSLNIIPYTFTQQMETLKNAGYTFVTMSELIDMLDGKIRLPEKPVAITFDDGYKDFYTDVFPILKKYNIKVTAYIISGVLDQPNYMITPQLREVAKSGFVEIGAHTVHHYALRGIGFEVAKYEIEESKKELERITKTSVVSFAYPNGSFDDQSVNIVKESGFKSAVSTIHGFEINHDNKYSIYRIHPGNKVDDALLNYLEQK